MTLSEQKVVRRVLAGKQLSISETGILLGRKARTLRDWEKQEWFPQHLHAPRDRQGERRYSLELIGEIIAWMGEQGKSIRLSAGSASSRASAEEVRVLRERLRRAAIDELNERQIPWDDAMQFRLPGSFESGKRR